MKILLPRTLEPGTIPWPRMARATALASLPQEIHRLREILDRFGDTLATMDRTASTTEDLGKTLSDLKAR
jgi:hypothetical protein